MYVMGLSYQMIEKVFFSVQTVHTHPNLPACLVINEPETSRIKTKCEGDYVSSSYRDRFFLTMKSTLRSASGMVNSPLQRPRASDIGSCGW